MENNPNTHWGITGLKWITNYKHAYTIATYNCQAKLFHKIIQDSNKSSSYIFLLILILQREYSSVSSFTHDNSLYSYISIPRHLFPLTIKDWNILPTYLIEINNNNLFH